MNKEPLTNISSLKLMSSSVLLSDGTGRSSAPAAEAALRSRPDGSDFVEDQARRDSESFRTTASCWTPITYITYGGFGEEILVHENLEKELKLNL
ncbi:MAG: hypothetical protein Q8P66_02610 [Candidatus Colwellbacteria bacterium]|nr:hypothetical protein [Candidatus Colwellbacteria bacterium]